ncbi:MAG: YicC family protein [Eubacterium sp.]|nr:YicC family protein [Eubacterium sp.]
MVRSMTGYGKYEAENEDARLTVEIKSVNHRYCDISIRLPKNLNLFENDIRRQIKKSVSRGKIDVYITYETLGSGAANITYNRDLARSYMELLAGMALDFQIANDLDAFTLSKYPEVFTLQEQAVDTEKLRELVDTTVAGALKEFIRAREAEGEELKKDLLLKLSELKKAADDIAGRSPHVFEDYKERLRAKVTELLGDTKLDESVMATELVIYADKICVDEELVRMNSHIKHMRETLENEESVGRKLDFIAQELNREANTTLSKANDQVISDQGILLKTEIEKIREQIQNLE